LVYAISVLLGGELSEAFSRGKASITGASIRAR